MAVFLVVLRVEDALSALAVGVALGLGDWLLWRRSGWAAKWYLRSEPSN
jgi:hypothetical protein